MKQLVKIMVFLTALAVSGLAIAGADRGSADEAVALVKKVVADMKKYGKQKVIQDVQSQNSRYRDRDLYVAIGSLDGMSLANGNNPKLAGRNVLDIKDADGKLFQRERIEIATTKGSGWQNYKWPDPVTKEIQSKSMYIERYEDMMIGCGIYKE